MLYRHDLPGLLRHLLLCGLTPPLLACVAPPSPPPIHPAAVEAVETNSPSSEKPHSPVPIKPAEAPAEPPARNTNTVVVEPGVEEGATASDLVSLARAERERRAKSSARSIVITNESLVKRPGPKNSAGAAKKGAGEAPSTTADFPQVLAREAQENLWKARAVDIRTRLKAANERTEKLRRLTANMRERFYLAPPMLGRDDSLWQEWGRLQESLAESEKASQTTEKELEMFLEEGRIAGADPGWLANGEELLVVAEESSPSPPAEAIEPLILPPPGEVR